MMHDNPVDEGSCGGERFYIVIFNVDDVARLGLLTPHGGAKDSGRVKWVPVTSGEAPSHCWNSIRTGRHFGPRSWCRRILSMLSKFFVRILF